MFQELKTLFARSWEAFVAERDLREPEDRVAEMLSAMRRELVEARAALPLFDEAVQKAEAELMRERGAEADCERRRVQAERIGDAETARVAAEWAGRHRERAAVVEEKRAAALAERELRRREADQMARRYREADLQRHALVAELRRRERAGLGAANPEEGAEDPLRQWEEEIDDRAARAQALEELDALDRSAPPPVADDVDARLRELKRRMGAP